MRAIGVEQLVRKNVEPRDVDAIAGAQQHVVEGARAVIEVEHDAAVDRARALDRASAYCR